MVAMKWELGLSVKQETPVTTMAFTQICILVADFIFENSQN